MKNITIKSIKKQLDEVYDEGDPFISKLSSDPRIGVQQLLEKWHLKRHKQMLEKQRYEAMRAYELQAMKQGYSHIAGIDEVGRGPLAGPVVSAAVILHENTYIEGLNDSKKLSEQKRVELYEQIIKNAVSVGIGIITVEEIDRINIYHAAKKSMIEAVHNLTTVPDLLLVDAMELHTPYPEKSIIKGDSCSISIAAASIIAKVKRDQMMKEYHETYPQYGFDQHSGYGTKAHLDAIYTYGPCPIHRKSFAPIKSIME